MFDALSTYDLVADEIEQRTVTGHDVGLVAGRLAASGLPDPAPGVEGRA